MPRPSSHQKTPKAGTPSSVAESPSPLPVQITLSPQASKFLKKLSAKHFGQIQRKIEALITDPYPADRRTMIDYPDIFRLDAGEYRIAFTEHKTATEHLIHLEVVDRRNDSRIYDQVKRRLS